MLFPYQTAPQHSTPVPLLLRRSSLKVLRSLTAPFRSGSLRSLTPMEHQYTAPLSNCSGLHSARAAKYCSNPKLIFSAPLRSHSRGAANNCSATKPLLSTPLQSAPTSIEEQCTAPLQNRSGAVAAPEQNAPAPHPWSHVFTKDFLVLHGKLNHGFNVCTPNFFASIFLIWGPQTIRRQKEMGSKKFRIKQIVVHQKNLG